MRIVPAGVHDPFDLGGVGLFGLLINWQCIHIGSNSYERFFLIHHYIGYEAMVVFELFYLQSLELQNAFDEVFRMFLLAREFRVFVNVSAHFDDFVFESVDRLKERFFECLFIHFKAFFSYDKTKTFKRK